MEDLPLNGKTGHTGLLSQNIAADTVNRRLGRWVGDQLLGVVLVVDIVTDTHKLTAIIAASEENDSDTKNLRGRNALQVGRIGLEDELVGSDRDGTDQ